MFSFSLMGSAHVLQEFWALVIAAVLLSENEKMKIPDIVSDEDTTYITYYCCCCLKV